MAAQKHEGLHAAVEAVEQMEVEAYVAQEPHVDDFLAIVGVLVYAFLGAVSFYAADVNVFR